MVTSEEWLALRASVEQTADRLAALVEQAPQPQAPATEHWSVAETAAHVATVAALHNAMLAPTGAGIAIVDLAEILRTTTVDTVSALNDLTLAHFTDRDPPAVAAWLRSEVADLLRASEGKDPDHLVDWLGGSRLPVAGVLAHMLNELSIHGRDVARSVGVPWVIPAADAATFFDMFVVGLVRNGYGRLLDLDPPPSRRRVVVQFQSRTTSTVTLVLDDGQVSVDDHPDAIDVRVSYDPTMLNLMMFGRVSKARAVLTGKVVVGGRRPWLLPKFLETVRMPG